MVPNQDETLLSLSFKHVIAHFVLFYKIADMPSILEPHRFFGTELCGVFLFLLKYSCFTILC